MKGTSFFRLAATLALLSAGASLNASAQTRIGSVILTKPTTPAPVSAPAPRRVPAASSTGSSTSTSTSGISNVPAGWYEVRGRVGSNKPGSLPAGSTVTVLMEDATARGQFVQIQFKTSRLSTPYQIIFSPGRLNGSHKYTIRATVADAAGKELYSSYAYAVPSSARNVIDLPLR